MCGKQAAERSPSHERVNTGLNPALPLATSAATPGPLRMLTSPLEGGGGVTQKST